MKYEIVIGLEVHLHLATRTKIFCGCPTEFGKEPNTQVCPVCLGFPGSLPVLNSKVIEHALKVALALKCRIQDSTKFDRKNYFYPDLPKAYQISQYDLPLSRQGYIEISAGGIRKRIGIRRVHIEEDAGKLIHRADKSLVDFNRAGVPLLEIVSEPDINSPEEAHEYLKVLKGILSYLDVSDCDMEKGSLRCDANISLKSAGSKELGIKTELKNMNSFKNVKDALAFEAGRQREALSSGEKLVQETRLWEPRSGKTISMRTKEKAQDYRYFPEPDLPLYVISQQDIESARKSLPLLPEEKKKYFMREYGISEHDAGLLIYSKKEADFAEVCIKAYPGKNKKLIVNWLIGPLLSEANIRGCAISDLKILPQDLADLIGFSEREEISNLNAKAVLSKMLSDGGRPGEIIKADNLLQVSDSAILKEHADEVIKENPKSAADYRRGKQNALMFLVGQLMKKTKGKANPKAAQEILKRRMEDA